IKKAAAHAEYLSPLRTLDGNAQIDVLERKSVVHAVNEIRLIVADDGPVVRINFAISIYIFIFHISRSCGIVVWVSMQIGVIPEYADLLVPVKATYRLS